MYFIRCVICGFSRIVLPFKHIILSGANKCNCPGHCLQLFVGVNCFVVVKAVLNFSILYADPKISILAVAFSTVCFNFNRFGLPLVNGKIIVGKQRKQLNMSVFLRYQKFSSILISAVNFTCQTFNFFSAVNLSGRILSRKLFFQMKFLLSKTVKTRFQRFDGNCLNATMFLFSAV